MTPTFRPIYTPAEPSEGFTVAFDVRDVVLGPLGRVERRDYVGRMTAWTATTTDGHGLGPSFTRKHHAAGGLYFHHHEQAALNAPMLEYAKRAAKEIHVLTYENPTAAQIHALRHVEHAVKKELADGHDTATLRSILLWCKIARPHHRRMHLEELDD